MQSPAEREKRLEFLRNAVGVARLLGIGVVSFWSGTLLTKERPDLVMKRLVEGCREFCWATMWHMRSPAVFVCGTDS